MAIDVVARVACAQQRTTRVAHTRVYGSSDADRVRVDLRLDANGLDLVAARLVAADLNVGHLKHMRHHEVLLVARVHEAVAHDLAACADAYLILLFRQTDRHELLQYFWILDFDLDQGNVRMRAGCDSLNKSRRLIFLKDKQ